MRVRLHIIWKGWYDYIVFLDWDWQQYLWMWSFELHWPKKVIWFSSRILIFSGKQESSETAFKSLLDAKTTAKSTLRGCLGQSSTSLRLSETSHHLRFIDTWEKSFSNELRFKKITKIKTWLTGAFFNMLIQYVHYLVLTFRYNPESKLKPSLGATM